MTDPVKTGVSLDELMQHEWVEVIDGEIVKVDVMLLTLGRRFVADTLYRILKHCATEQQLGYVFNGGLTYALHIDANGVQSARIPDVSFIRSDHMRHNFSPDGAYPGCPDLAIEVITPAENMDYLMGKVGDYLLYGAQQVWVLDPPCRAVYVYRAGDNIPYTCTDADILTAESLFPGLKISIADLFMK